MLQAITYWGRDCLVVNQNRRSMEFQGCNVIGQKALRRKSIAAVLEGVRDRVFRGESFVLDGSAKSWGGFPMNFRCAYSPIHTSAGKIVGFQADAVIRRADHRPVSDLCAWLESLSPVPAQSIESFPLRSDPEMMVAARESLAGSFRQAP